MRPQIAIRRAADRFFTPGDGIDAWHCFSYAAHYDPDNTSFGVLVACNDFTVAPGCGFSEHGHRELEIVSWVLSGRLRHQDSTGNSTVLGPGNVQHLTAGTGARHAETNPFDEPLRFVQFWVVPHEPAQSPSYDHADLRAALAAGDLVVAASGRPGVLAPVRLRQPAATLHVASLTGERVLPAAPYLFVYVAHGAVTLSGAERLQAGDQARLTGPAGVRVTAAADETAGILVWEMHDRI